MSGLEPPFVFVVSRIIDVSPRMRRVTFSGQGVRDYGRRVPNIKLFFPLQAEAALDLPSRDGDRYVWHDGARERVRTYTVRRLDLEAGELDVDFVRHGDEGVASAWVERARLGSRLGALGGGGLTIREASWVLFVGDESALPAISGILESLGGNTEGVAIIEVADVAEEQALVAPPGVEVRWLHRDGAAPDSSSGLLETARRVVIPGGVGARVWVAGESSIVRGMRRHLSEIGFDRRDQMVIGYWHRGLDEPGYTSSSDHDRRGGELQTTASGVFGGAEGVSR